jgi:nicotinic acid mononucleotide adenylyltransferase
MKTIVITFGRMNPPTVGHQKLVQKVQTVARANRADSRIYLSHTQNNKKDPLTYEQKISLAREAFGNIVVKSDAKTIIEVSKELQKGGYTDLILVVGSDRIAEFERLLNKYNGKEYNFNSIKVVSAGERDPDAEGVEGMSASKLRKLALAGDYEAFASGLPKNVNDKRKRQTYETIRDVIKEELDLLPEELQEAVYSGNIGAMEMIKFFQKSTEQEKKTLKDLIAKKKNKEAWDMVQKKLGVKLMGKEFQKEEIDMDEERKPLTVQQRMQRSRTLKRLQPKLQRYKKMRAKRMADEPRLKKKAQKAAIAILRKKVAGERGANYANLSSSDKISVDRLIAKKSGAIAKLAKRLIPKIRKQELERVKKARSSTNEAYEVAQDKTIGSKPGTQPKKYYSGLSKSEKETRNAQFKRAAEKDSSDPSAYPDKHAGDAGVKTKPSKYTKKYKDMFGEASNLQKAKDEIRSEKQDDKRKFDAMLDRARLKDTAVKNRKSALRKEDVEYEINESAEAALRKKAEKSGISYGTLKKVYDRGMAAWRTGHRPGATQQQWAFARVNSYITKGKTYHTADSDLREEGGAGEEGTDKLVKKYKKGTPFSEWRKKTVKEEIKTCCDDCDKYFDHIVEEAEHQGRKVKLNDPFRTPSGPKKFSVYVKNDKGNVVKVNFGDPNMEIKRDDPDRRKNFRARHNCENPGPKWKARYWSCYQWRSGAKVDS